MAQEKLPSLELGQVKGDSQLTRMMQIPGCPGAALAGWLDEDDPDTKVG